MTVKYELHMTVKQTGEKVSLSGEVSDEEVKLFEDFVQYAEEVWNTDFIQKGEHGELNIDWDRDSGTKITALLPKWKEVIVFLYKLRPLVLNNEKTNFYQIHNLLAKKLGHPYFRKSLGLQHELYSGKFCQSEFQIRSNEVLINSEKVLFDWLNSHEYHRDEDKRKFIESLHQMFLPLDASKVIFLKLLMHKAVATINVANLILVVLGKKKEMTVKMRPPEEKK